MSRPDVIATHEPGQTLSDAQIGAYSSLPAMAGDSDAMQSANTDQHYRHETTPSGYAVAFSAGIRAIEHIGVFLNVEAVLAPAAARKKVSQLRCVLVWGRKQNTRRALRFARDHDLPVWFIEDGWIRSSAKDAHSRRCYSLLVDREGVYYDSTRPSELESFLNLPDEQFADHCPESALEYARICRQRMVDMAISKYNYCRSASPDALSKHAEKSLVLVVDQTRDDASVRFGALGSGDFIDMLDMAVRENPTARIVVRTHPDVVEGRRQGYLSDYAAQLGIEISAEGDNPLHWLKKASRVYVGTSQLGFEALMCGCQVVVAGKPFYAGWGLTDDRQTMQRRYRTRTLDQLFHASHVYLARYCNPVSGQIWQLHECLEHVAEQKKHFALNAHDYVCLGVTGWKKRYLSQYLRSPDGQIRFSRKDDSRAQERPLCWSFQRSATANTGMVRVEDGFLRSQGLGSDFVAPGSLVIDSVGLYFDPSTPSELENLLNFHDCSLEQSLRAARLRRRILQARVSKYNVGNTHTSGEWLREEIGSRPVALVLGQVEDDQSILKGCAEIASNTELCRKVRECRPDAFVVYKPHPDVESGNRRGRVTPSVLKECVDYVEYDRPIADCLDNASELHTLTSLAGFEALLRNKTVYTYGMPFYAGWGLSHDHLTCDRRRRTRTLDELVYFSLIAYPRYLDVRSGEFITAEQQVEQLIANARPGAGPAVVPRWISKLRNVASALTYKP